MLNTRNCARKPNEFTFCRGSCYVRFACLSSYRRARRAPNCTCMGRSDTAISWHIILEWVRYGAFSDTLSISVHYRPLLTGHDYVWHRIQHSVHRQVDGLVIPTQG